MTRASDLEPRSHVRALAVAVLSAVALLATAASVNAATVGTFSNVNPILVPGLGFSGPANPNPSPITVAGTAGVITDLKVRLHNAVDPHTYAEDIDVLLVAPSGHGIVLMSDACGNTDFTGTVVFGEPATVGLSDNTSCTMTPTAVYAPVNYPGIDAWLGAPAGPYATRLSSLFGTGANGDWKLYISDDANTDSGQISGGWSLEITTAPIGIPYSGPASPNPVTRTVSGLAGTIADVNVLVNGLSHTHLRDLDVVLQSPAGTTSYIMSDACGTDALSYDWLIDDEAPAPLSDSDPGCDTFSYRPSNYGSAADVFTASGAPLAPFGTALSVFDGQSPNGDWKLWIQDDTDVDFGSLDDYSLQFQLAPPPVPVIPCAGKMGRSLRRCKARQVCIKRYKGKVSAKSKKNRAKCLKKARERR